MARKGRSVSGVFLVLKFAKNNLAQSRAGFVVSKKISNKAVIRNKTKRRLRETVRMFLSDLKPGYDLIVFTKKGAEEKSLAEIEREIERLLKRAGLFGD